MTNITKAHISDLLTVMTGIMVSQNGFSKVHQLIEFICECTVFTHQLPRVVKEMRPELEKQFPQFKDILTHKLEPDQVDSWVQDQIQKHGEWFEVSPIKIQQREPIMELMDLIS